MDTYTIVSFVLMAAVVGRFLYSRLKYGSWTGAFLGASITRTMGAVSFQSSWTWRQTLEVHVMKKSSADEPFVGLTLISKAPLAISMAPYKLTRSQALELAHLLQEAATGCHGEKPR